MPQPRESAESMATLPRVNGGVVVVMLPVAMVFLAIKAVSSIDS